MRISHKSVYLHAQYHTGAYAHTREHVCFLKWEQALSWAGPPPTLVPAHSEQPGDWGLLAPLWGG